MTREEAVKAALKAKAKWGGGSSENWLVLALEALGLLKLDEPAVSLEGQLAIALGWPEGGRSHGEITAALKVSGLTLVAVKPSPPQENASE